MNKSRLSDWEDKHETLLAELLSSQSGEAENQNQNKNNNDQASQPSHQGSN
jgi:hypothetical protein